MGNHNLIRGKQQNRTVPSIASVILAVSAVCLVFAIMQGIHDNYGIMLPGIMERSGIRYASIARLRAIVPKYVRRRPL